MLNDVIYVGKTYKFYFDELGILRLILTEGNDYLNEDQIINYLTVLPQIYDEVVSMNYDQLILANTTIGTYMRDVFGMFHPNNPKIMYNAPVNDDSSPEATSFRILKKIWFSAQATKSYT